jgi:hypothetical protein
MKVEVYFTDIEENRLVIKTGIFKNRLEIAAACLIQMDKASDINSAMIYLEGKGFKVDDALLIGFDKVMSLGTENEYFAELIYINGSLQWTSSQVSTSRF